MNTASLQLGEPIEMTSQPVLAGFAGLDERHYEAVFRAALRVTGRPADAEDVLQTVFLRVLSGRDQDEAAVRPAAYFRRAAVTPPSTCCGGGRPTPRWPTTIRRRMPPSSRRCS